MIKSVNNYPAFSPFDIKADVVHSVASYQCEYIWGKSQLESLFKVWVNPLGTLTIGGAA